MDIKNIDIKNMDIKNMDIKNMDIDLKNMNIEKNINIIIKKIEKPNILNYVKENDFKNIEYINNTKIIPMNFFNIITYYINLFVKYINNYKIYIFIILLLVILFFN